MSASDPYAELRPRAFAIAYRMLGSVSEDVVQEACPVPVDVAQFADGPAEAFPGPSPVHVCTPVPGATIASSTTPVAR